MVRFWRIVLQLQGILAITGAVLLRCYKSKDLSDNEVATFDDAGNLIKSKCWDVSRMTVMYVHGFTEGKNSNTTKSFLNAALTIGGWNVLLVDWEEEASSIGPAPLEVAGSYAFHSVPNTINVGYELGVTIVKLRELNLNLNLFQLVGHSLGAQLAGYAGKTVRALGYLIKFIIGLDPAGPLYNFPIVIHLDEFSAAFVLAIHTDPWGYGLGTSCGTVDVWVNLIWYLNGTKAQPGCKPTPEELGNFCSHTRSVQIIVASMYDNKQFIASKANNYYEWVEQNGKGSDIIYVGENTDMNARGNYYMSINGEEPFGKGVDGLKP